MSKIRSLISYAADDYRRYFISVVCLALMITFVTVGCNYRLSGMSGDELMFSPLLKNISIEGVPRFDAFRLQLKKDALSYRMKVVSSESATTRVIVKNKEIEQQAITIGDDAKVREYLLTVNVDFSIIVIGDISHDFPPIHSVQSETTYAYYPQHVSISLNEKKRALDFLNRDLSAKLIDRLRILTHRV